MDTHLHQFSQNGIIGFSAGGEVALLAGAPGRVDATAVVPISISPRPGA